MEIPIYPSGDAISLLTELADAMELQVGDRYDGVIVCEDDVKALRWALKVIALERRGAEVLAALMAEYGTLDSGVSH